MSPPIIVACDRVSFKGGGAFAPPPPLEICGFISLTKGKSVCMIYKFESFIKRQKHNIIQLQVFKQDFSRLPLPYFNNGFKVIVCKLGW